MPSCHAALLHRCTTGLCRWVVLTTSQGVLAGRFIDALSEPEPIPSTETYFTVDLRGSPPFTFNVTNDLAWSPKVNASTQFAVDITDNGSNFTYTVYITGAIS